MATSNLDPKPDPRDSPDTPEDNEPDTVATPEGDAEGPPDAPPFPVPPGMQIPPFDRHQQALTNRSPHRSGNQARKAREARPSDTLLLVFRITLAHPMR